jgi:hypothetical protein
MIGSAVETVFSRGGLQPLSMCLQSMPLLTTSFDAASIHAATLTTSPILAASTYMFLSNVFYLARRAKLRKRSMWNILQTRITKEPGLSLGMFVLCFVAWQTLVMSYPVTESVARSFGYTLFFYSYPNANGGGYILEPLAVQDLPSNKRTRAQMRLDWHKFKFNVGNIGRDGFQHPPTMEKNLPHIDVPQRGIKHWPWRRRRRHATIPRTGGARLDSLG